LRRYHPEDVARELSGIENTGSLLSAFYSLPEGVDSLVLPFLDTDALNVIITNSPPDKIGSIIEGMESDDAADVLATVSEEAAEDILDTVSEEVDRNISTLMEHSADTAGGIMRKEFFAVPETATVDETIGRLRAALDILPDAHNIFVVDSTGRLKGTLPSMELLFSGAGTLVGTLVTGAPVTVTAETDQEEVARIFKKYDLISMPVLDDNRVIIGVITVDDIVDIVEAEAGEDMLKMAGAEAESFQRSHSALKLASLRTPWLVSSLAGGAVTGTILWHFSSTLNSLVALATFIPMVMGLSGNVGSQSSALVIHGLASGKVNLGSARKYILRESRVALTLSIMFGIISGSFAYIWQGNFVIGAAVGAAVLLSISIASLMGTMIPLFFQLVKLDPAIAGGPLTLALNDITALFFYLGIATALINFFGM